MKWRDVINGLSKAGDEFLNSECGNNVITRLAMKYMTQDELWSHHDDTDPRIRYVVAQKINDQDKLWSMQFDPMTAYDVIQVKRTIASRITSVEHLMILIGDEDRTVSDYAKVRLDEVMRGHKEETV